MKQWLVRILTAASIIVVLAPSSAHAASERVTRFESAIHVSRANIVTINETINYDFGGLTRHGIFRTVPVEYRPSADTTYYVRFELLTVTDASGKEMPVKTEMSGGAAVLRIGDPDKTVSGTQTYKISYRLSPLVTSKDGQDVVSLNVIGNKWEVPIDEAEAVIRADDAEFVSPMCFVGPFGTADASRCSMTIAPGSATIKASRLAAGDDMTFEASLPGGYVDHYLQPNEPIPMPIGQVIAIVGAVAAGAIVIIVGATVLILRQMRERRRKKNQTIIALYEPPAGLTPAQIGLLHDDKSTMVEITATLIDLAVRGHLLIEQVKPKGLLTPAQYRLTKLHPSTPDAKLQSYEVALLDGLFKTSDAIVLKDIDKTAMASVISGIHSQLKDSLKDKGFYGRMGTEPGIIEKALDAGNISDEGAKKWAEVKGFELYLTVAERDRLNFTDAPEKTPKLFNSFLPYAVALGVEREWAKQFEGMDLSKDSSWYVTPSGMHYGALALTDNLSGSFSSTIASSFTAPSSGGGGGFSGGGFGGGGGGSW